MFQSKRFADESTNLVTFFGKKQCGGGDSLILVVREYRTDRRVVYAEWLVSIEANGIRFLNGRYSIKFGRKWPFVHLKWLKPLF